MQETEIQLRRSPGFVRFLLAFTLSRFGDRFRLVTLTLWVFVGSDEDPFARVFLLLLGVLPSLLLGVFSGVLADRGNQRLIMVVSDLLRAICSVLLIVSFWLDEISIVYVVVLVASLVDVFFASSSFALLPRIVPREQLGRANGVLETASQAVAVIAPALAGLAFVAFGAAFAFALDALTYVLSALLLASISVRRDVPAEDAEETPAQDWRTRWRTSTRESLQEARQGLAYLRRHPVAKWFILTVAGLTITANANSVALLFLLVQDLDAPLSTLGLVFSLNGLIAVGSAVVATVFAARLSQGYVLLSCLAAMMVSQFGMGLSPNVLILSLFVIVSAAANAPYSIAYDTVLQQAVDQEFLGRVDGVDNTFSAALQMVVLLGSGLLITVAGARWVFVASGVLGGLCVLVGLLFLMPRLKRSVVPV